MGTTRKTITVTDQQDKWIKAQIDSVVISSTTVNISVI